MLNNVNRKSAAPRNQNKAANNLSQLKNQLLREIRRELAPSRGGRVARPSQLRSKMKFSSDEPMAFAPVAQSKTTKTQRPKMQSLPNGDCRIRHREYISDITAASGTPSGFSDTQFSVNPGQVNTFPWLSQIASRFESYRFDSLKFDYETEAPSSLGGTLVLAIDYDAADPAPTSKQEAMAFRSSVRSAPWKNCCHSSVPEDLHKSKTLFVRPGGVPSNTDIKTYDVGTLNVITQNITTASAVCGELYVDYDVLLMTPVYETNSSGGILYVPTVTAAAPFTAGQAAGTITISGVNATKTLTCTGLTIGQEYILGYNAGGAAQAPVFTVPTGWTAVTASVDGNDQGFATFLATSNTASVVCTWGGNTTLVTYFCCPVPFISGVSF